MGRGELRPATTAAKRSLWIALALGAALRLAWWWYARPDPVSDFEYYRRYALTLLVHGQLGFPEPSAERVPLYPAFLAGLMLVSRSIAWLSVANIALSIALIAVVYGLARTLTGNPRAAGAAAVICAVNPAFVLLAPVLASEHLYALALFASLWLVAGGWLNPPRRTARLCAAGALFGCAVLTRPDALFYLPLVIGLALASGAGAVRARLAAIAIILVCAGVVVTPWYVRNQLVLGPGAGISTSGGVNFYFGHREGGPGYRPLDGTPLAGQGEVERQRIGYALGWEHIASSGPAQLARDAGVATRILFWSTDAASLHWSTRAAGRTPDESTTKPLGALASLGAIERIGYLALLAAALAALLARRQARAFALVAWGIVILTWFGYAVAFTPMARYRYVAELAFCLLAGAAITRLVPARAPGDGG